MAYTNKVIFNPQINQEIKFLQTSRDTNGVLLEMESSYKSRSKEPPAHYHPYQNEVFTVISGKLTVRIDGQLKTLMPGDTLDIPKNTVHSMWNNTDDKTVVNWKVQPAMDTEYFLETTTGLAADNKTNKQGMPPIWQVVLLANKYSAIFRLSKPPYPLQRVLFLLLTPLAYMLGYRSTYRKYLD